MMERSTLAQRATPWWRVHMVWLIILLPLSAVIGSFTSLFIAIRHADDIVKTEYTKTGMVTQVHETPLLRAKELGLGGAMRLDAGVLNLQLRATQVAVERIAPSELQVLVVHPTHADLDQQIALRHAEQGQYQARINLTGEGKRYIILQPANGNWRLQGVWYAPFNEETSLSAYGAITPPSRPHGTF